jgi:D-sedoheptulose 7-phosphate isomerase
MSKLDFSTFGRDYLHRLNAAAQLVPLDSIEELAKALLECLRVNRQVFIFGNGGSAGNAIHLANDYLYGISGVAGNALRVHALPANSAVVTCLANDEGYEHVFAHQLAVLAKQGDIALALSGSGNSLNIFRGTRVFWWQG